MEDEARAVAPSERQARPSGRGNVSAVVLDARSQRRANEPAVVSEPESRPEIRRLPVVPGFAQGVPAVCGVSVEPDVILFHKNSGWGMPPDPETTLSRATR